MNLTAEIMERLKLLYVEDEMDARTILTSMIEAKYPTVTLNTAQNGKQGVESYSRDNTDILVTDISMPVMDGLQMARSIKAMNPEVMIIVLTARTDTQYLLDCIDIGINQYVLKPIDSLHLFAAIDKCIETISMKRTVNNQHEFITRINAELMARTKELEMLNNELEAFNYTVSHDLKTPLTVIKGYCQLANEVSGSSMNPASREFLGEILASVDQMNDLIATLLNFSRISRTELEIRRTNLSNMAVEICQNLKGSDPSGREIDFRIMPGVQANGDATLLRVLLDNLLGNSWKYTGTKKDAVIEFGYEEMCGRSVYYVRDNGIGFDSKYSDTVFAPFQRLDNSSDFEGNGIGLATAKRIIQHHGGEIWAEGETGNGATIYFTLPQPDLSVGKENFTIRP